MSYPNSPPPGYAYPPVRTGMPTGVKIALGCLIGCGVLILLCVVGFGLLVRGLGVAGKGMQAADRTARQFLHDVDTNQIDQAYALTSTGWARSTTREEFRNFVDYWHKQQGRFLSITQTGFYLNGFNGSVSIQLSYRIHGSKRDGDAVMVLVPDPKDLRIQSCHFTPHSSTGNR